MTTEILSNRLGESLERAGSVYDLVDANQTDLTDIAVGIVREYIGNTTQYLKSKQFLPIGFTRQIR